MGACACDVHRPRCFRRRPGSGQGDGSQPMSCPPDGNGARVSGCITACHQRWKRLFEAAFQSAGHQGECVRATTSCGACLDMDDLDHFFGHSRAHAHGWRGAKDLRAPGGRHHRVCKSWRRRGRAQVTNNEAASTRIMPSLPSLLALSRCTRSLPSAPLSRPPPRTHLWPGVVDGMAWQRRSR